MTTASIADLKKELKTLPTAEVIELCLRLAKYKKENKELLTFLLFSAGDIDGYIVTAKHDMEDAFATVSSTSIYFAKKSLRKILKDIGKNIRHASNVQVEVELLLHFCQLLHHSGWLRYRATPISNLYTQQLKKLAKAIAQLHEDLQYDYQKLAGELPEFPGL